MPATQFSTKPVTIIISERFPANPDRTPSSSATETESKWTVSKLARVVVESIFWQSKRMMCLQHYQSRIVAKMTLRCRLTQLVEKLASPGVRQIAMLFLIVVVAMGITECVTCIVTVDGDIWLAGVGISDLYSKFFRHVIVLVPHMEDHRTGYIRYFVEMFVDLGAVIGNSRVDFQACGGEICQGAAHAKPGNGDLAVTAGSGFQVGNQRGNVVNCFISVDHAAVAQALIA